jgi:excisionase family DNA binding protein
LKLLLNKAEASSALSISIRTLEILVRDKKIPQPVKVGGRVLFKASDLQSFVEELGDDPVNKSSDNDIGVTKKPSRGRPRLAINL